MATREKDPAVVRSRPQRADARDAFAEDGTSASLEDIARRAGVGIGTLYRHFPTRQDVFESVYVDEVEGLCRAANELPTDLSPWDALIAWLHRFVLYAATKRALAEALNHDSGVFLSCRGAIYAAGEPLLQRAQQAGAARPDTSFDDLVRLISGITMIHFAEPDQIERVLGLALDGLRYQPPGTEPRNRTKPSQRSRQRATP
jgi:AcrR family transcriptional regulator